MQDYVILYEFPENSNTSFDSQAEISDVCVGQTEG